MRRLKPLKEHEIAERIQDCCPLTKDDVIVGQMELRYQIEEQLLLFHITIMRTRKLTKLKSPSFVREGQV